MFLTKGNVETIWDVLHYEKIPNMNQQVFINNIKLFGEKERNPGLSLFQMNTKFIIQKVRGRLRKLIKRLGGLLN